MSADRKAARVARALQPEREHRERPAPATMPGPIDGTAQPMREGRPATPAELEELAAATSGGFGAVEPRAGETRHEDAEHDEGEEVESRAVASGTAGRAMWAGTNNHVCSNCVSFRAFPNQKANAEVTHGICTCNPPVPALMGVSAPAIVGGAPQLQVRAMWPPVQSNWDCRKFKPKQMDS